MIKRFIKKTLKWTSIALALVIATTYVPATMGAYGLFWERWTTHQDPQLKGTTFDPANETHKFAFLLALHSDAVHHPVPKGS